MGIKFIRILTHMRNDMDSLRKYESPKNFTGTKRDILDSGQAAYKVSPW